MVSMCVQIMNCTLEIVHHESHEARHHQKTLECIHLEGIHCQFVISLLISYFLFLISFS